MKHYVAERRLGKTWSSNKEFEEMLAGKTT
jgi:hypothetical protein